jgi:hypothetical protein
MNARVSLFVKTRQSPTAAKLTVCVCVCALLSGCIGNPFEDAAVDPRSPIAKEVPKLVKADAAYPTFAAVPPVPKDVRPHKQYGVAAAQIDKAAADLERATADDTWTLKQDTSTYAAAARAAAGPDRPATTATDTEAFAQALRKRATPPPPAKH